MTSGFKHFNNEQDIVDYTVDELIASLQSDADQSEAQDDDEQADETRARIDDISRRENLIKAAPLLRHTLRNVWVFLSNEVDTRANGGKDTEYYKEASDLLKAVENAISKSEEDRPEQEEAPKAVREYNVSVRLIKQATVKVRAYSAAQAEEIAGKLGVNGIKDSDHIEEESLEVLEESAQEVDNV